MIGRGMIEVGASMLGDIDLAVWLLVLGSECSNKTNTDSTYKTSFATYKTNTDSGIQLGVVIHYPSPQITVNVEKKFTIENCITILVLNMRI